MNTYEVMFLLDPAFASKEEAADKEINRLMERASGQIIARHRWDERRLAYEIKRRKRGVYFLVYMRAPSASIPSLERDVQLSEGILRVLVTRADHVSEEKMHHPIAPPSEYTRRTGDDWSRGGRRAEARPGARPRREPEGKVKAEAREAGPESKAAVPAGKPDEAQASPTREEPVAPAGAAGGGEAAGAASETGPAPTDAEASSEQAQA